MRAAGRLLRLRGEGNLGTLFSGGLLAVAAALFALVATVERIRRSRDVVYWRVLALGFLYLSADELLALHERMNGPMRALLGDDRAAMLHFAWVLPAIVAVLLVGISLVGFWRRLEPDTRLRTAVAAAVYLGGAFGMEVVGGAHARAHGATAQYVAIATIEEALEMAGVILLIRALLDLLGSRGTVLALAPTPMTDTASRPSPDPPAALML